jgi:hypothetical protein
VAPRYWEIGLINGGLNFAGLMKEIVILLFLEDGYLRAAAVVGNYCRQQPLATHRDKMERGQHFGAGIALFKINAYYYVVYNFAGWPVIHVCVSRTCTCTLCVGASKKMCVYLRLYTRSLDTAIKKHSSRICARYLGAHVTK